MGWLVLAAGFSKRFNGDKLLYRVGSDDRALVELTLRKYLEQADPILVVTRPDQVLLHQLLSRLKVEFTISPVSDDGMGSSLAWGVSKIQSSWRWVGVVLADMALVSSQTLTSLKCSVSENNIVLPKFTLPSRAPARLYSGRTTFPSHGHPVLFGCSFYGCLMKLEGDVGARVVLQRYSDNIVELMTQDCGVVLDVDSRLDMTVVADMLRGSRV